MAAATVNYTKVRCLHNMKQNKGKIKSLRRWAAAIATAMLFTAAAPCALADEPSAVQIISSGGTVTSQDGKVNVSKTIDGTELENVFDITLKVTTGTSLQEFAEEPDMAVIMVMDVSNTMLDPFGSTTRATAAIKAANSFIDKFAAKTSSASRLGVVLFNRLVTYPNELKAQPCSNTAQAESMKSSLLSNMEKILKADGYSRSHDRFTNIEGGIKQAHDILNKLSNRNKFIILLSDGFPTTYVQPGNGYNGWDPYCTDGQVGTDGVFYDFVRQGYCTIGTCYSDKAAIRAKEAAAAAKQSGITMFSVGVDIGGQTIAKYLENEEYNFVDRTSEVYEIGSDSSATAYKAWLKNSIGSGYYYDSDNPAQLEDAYAQIFEEIIRLWKETSKPLWTAADPLPGQIEFIGFYNRDGDLVSPQTGLVGSNAELTENTAGFDTVTQKINWSLQLSGYESANVGGSTRYTYTLRYRVRLKNELESFSEEQSYNTNGAASLCYQLMELMDGEVKLSDIRDVEFPMPTVKGFLTELEFTKLGGTDEDNAQPLSGAVFTLSHDTSACSICRGDETAVEILQQTAVSDGNGRVYFANIPSGHKYTLTETTVPVGFWSNGDTYTVTAAYNTLKTVVTHKDGTAAQWDGDNIILNLTGYQLPNTGGVGTTPFTLCGLLLTAAPLAARRRRMKKRKEASKSSDSPTKQKG